MSRVISGFPGVGKTHFWRGCTHMIVQDSDSSEFSWIKLGERNPEFPDNYIKHIEGLLGEADVILVSSHKVVRDALVNAGISFVLVYPRRDAKEQYLERYRVRGNEEAFRVFLSSNWDAFIDEMEAQSHCSKMELLPGQYLSDVL